MRTLWQFFSDHIPDGITLLYAGPIGLLWSWACLRLAGWLKQRRRWRTGYTRKVFHFLTFGSVAFIYSAVPLIQSNGDLHPDPHLDPHLAQTVVCVFGGMTSIVILFALIRGKSNVLYEAMAREKDAPFRTRYIVMPYVATLVGGIASFAWFGPFAVAGILITGVADAVAEPVGTRFGKHRYRVPFSTGKAVSERSLEGSLAVFIAAFFCVLIANQIGDFHASYILMKAFVIALACCLAEACSPHGWDNLTMQLLPSWMMWAMVAG